ncbi:MAG: hypothetical protein NXI22_18360, partial [bacterium]|nr:hypothetical protein [bacterium]
ANVRPTVDDYRVIFPDIAGEIEPAAQAIIDRTDKEWADRSDNYDNNIRFRYTVASIEATPFVIQDEFDRMLYGEMMSMLGEGVRLYEVRVDFDGIGVAEELSFFAYVNKRWVWIGNLREVPDYLRKFR